MKLATKLSSMFLIVILLIIVVEGYSAVISQTRLFEEEIGKQIEHLRDAVVASLDANGRDSAMQLIQQANVISRRTTISWVWFDATADSAHSPQVAVLASEITQTERGVLIPGVYTPDEEMLAYAHVPGARPGGLEMEASVEPLGQFKTDILIRVLRQAGIMVFVGGVITVLLGSRMVARPLQRLVEKTRRIGQGDLSGPLELPGHDELSGLADGLNAMCTQLSESQERIRQETAGRIATLEKLRHADRLGTVGRLAAGIAHELGTPLNVISGHASMICGGKLPPEQVAENARTIKEQSERIAKIIREVLDFARQSKPDKSQADIPALTRQTAGLLRSLVEKHGSEIVVDQPDTPLLAEVDGAQIQQVLANLMVNGVQAMPHGGRVRITLTPVTARPPDEPDARENSCIRVDVQDEGSGVAQEHLEHLFDPFFTTKDVGQGTGLGLSIAYGIVAEHGGWIEVSSAPGKGSTFSIFLPTEARACQDES